MAVPGAGMGRGPCRALSGSSWPRSGRPEMTGVAGSGGAVVLSEPPFAGPEPCGYCLSGDAVGSLCCQQFLAADPEQAAPGERRGRGPRGPWHGTKLAKE